MTKIMLDHFYISVKNMDRAIKFYEDILEMKVSHREENTWADWDTKKGFYLGLINPKIISKKRKIGNNCTPVFWADNVDLVYKKVKKWKVKIIYPPTNLKFTEYPYRCFSCKDTEGNIIEIAKY